VKSTLNQIATTTASTALSSGSAAIWITAKAPVMRSEKVAPGMVPMIQDDDIDVVVLMGSNLTPHANTSPSSSSDITVTYYDILSRQSQRTHNFIDIELRKLEWDEDEINEEVVNRIANALDLVGEPGIWAAYLELTIRRKNRFTVEKLLLALSEAKDGSTERHRIAVLGLFSQASDAALRYSAVEALGNMASRSAAAKAVLNNIRRTESDKQISRIADLYGR
jgi:hypothetical protein